MTTNVSPEPASRIRTPLLLALALLSTVSAFSTDLYLPSFPEIATDLDTSASGVQLTLTTFFLGVALGQLLFGPLSDRFGRYPPLIVGLVLCTAASVLAVFAPTIEILILARFVQGVGGSAGMVIARAIVADLTRGREAARTFSLMMVLAGVAPILAPVLGGLLAAPLGWRGLLGIVLGVTLIMLASTLVVVRETYPAERRAAHRAESAAAGTRDVRALLSPVFLGYLLTLAGTYAALFAYISASPFLYQSVMGLSPAGNGIIFGVNAVCLLIMNFVNAKLVRSRPVPPLLRIGVVALFGATVLFALFAVLPVAPILLALPMLLLVASLGLVIGNGTALAIGSVPRSVAGKASAAIGTTQFGLGAAVSPLVGLGGETTAIPTAIVMVTGGFAALLGLALARRSSARGGGHPLA